jgi:hypothetical protein
LQIHCSVYSERTQYVLTQQSVGILDMEPPCTKHILSQYRGVCPQCIHVLTLSRSLATLPASAMTVRVLGYAGGKPAVFEVDRASPHSCISAAFLFRNLINPLLDSTGVSHARLTVKVPSQGSSCSPVFIKVMLLNRAFIINVLSGSHIYNCRARGVFTPLFQGYGPSAITRQ